MPPGACASAFYKGHAHVTQPLPQPVSLHLAEPVHQLPPAESAHPLPLAAVVHLDPPRVIVSQPATQSEHVLSHQPPTFEEIEAAAVSDPTNISTPATLRETCRAFAEDLPSQLWYKRKHSLDVRFAPENSSVADGNHVLTVQACTRRNFAMARVDVELYVDRLCNSVGLPRAGQVPEPLHPDPANGPQHFAPADGSQHFVPADGSLRLLIRFHVERNSDLVRPSEVKWSRYFTHEMALTTQFLLVAFYMWVTHSPPNRRHFAALGNLHMNYAGAGSYELRVNARDCDQPVDMAATFAFVHVGLETVSSLLRRVAYGDTYGVLPMMNMRRVRSAMFDNSPPALMQLAELGATEAVERVKREMVQLFAEGRARPVDVLIRVENVRVLVQAARFWVDIVFTTHDFPGMRAFLMGEWEVW